MALALFDFDGTLIEGDSDSSWNIFLIEQGLIDGNRYYAENENFYKQYVAGTLDIHAYQKFSLEALMPYTLCELQNYKETFYEKVIVPMVKKQTKACLDRHREAGDTLVMITATNGFVVDLACTKLGIPHLIACVAEVKDDRFTGNLVGSPSFREGKWIRFLDWKAKNAKKEDISQAYYYGDSINDFFILEKVGNPIVVDGDEQISKIAEQRGWKRISLL